MRAPQREREGPPSFRCASIAREGRGVPVAPVTIGGVEQRLCGVIQLDSDVLCPHGR